MTLPVTLLFASLGAVQFPGATQNLPKEVLDASIHGADTKVIFHVVDDEGRPVKDASVGAAFYMNGKKGYGRKGLTDGYGRFTARQMSVGEVNYGINKDGYYESYGRIWLAGDLYKAGEVKDGKWQPYGKTYEVVLKPIKDPIPMRAYHFVGQLCATNTLLGFDMEKGDFVTPHGHGKTTDFYLEYQEEEVTFWKYRAVLTMSFPNVMDGAYRAKKDNYSGFVSVYNADTNAVYRKKFVFDYNHLDWKKKENTTLSDGEYLILRTRTKINEKGELVEAYYSKIYGAMGFLHRGIKFCVHMNPTPNSTNLEFDVNKNLKKDIPSFRETRAP